MAGRPKKMAKRVKELVEHAIALEEDVSELIPDQYSEHDHCGSDPLGQAWRNALDAAEHAYFALVALLGILRVKAGIPIEDWDPDDEIDTPAPSDPEPGNPG